MEALFCAIVAAVVEMTDDDLEGIVEYPEVVTKPVAPPVPVPVPSPGPVLFTEIWSLSPVPEPEYSGLIGVPYAGSVVPLDESAWLKAGIRKGSMRDNIIFEDIKS